MLSPFSSSSRNAGSTLKPRFLPYQRTDTDGSMNCTFLKRYFLSCAGFLDEAVFLTPGIQRARARLKLEGRSSC